MPKLEDDDTLSKAPSLGQHTRDIMKSLGYTENQTDNLINEDVIK